MAETIKKPYSKVKITGLILGLVVFIVMNLFSGPADLGVVGWKVLSVIALMVIYWVTEAIPIGITAMMPMFLCPILGLAGSKTNADTGINPFAGFGSSSGLMIIGMLFLSAALVKWNLHRRIALNIIDLMGGKPGSILLGFTIATTFLSAFMSNTSTAAMLLPLGIAVCATLNLDLTSGYAKAIILSIAFGASIGSFATTIGSGTNVSCVALIKELSGIEVTFMDWMKMGAPFTIIIMLVMYAILYVVFDVKHVDFGEITVIKEEKDKLGKMGRGETMMAVYLVVALVLLMFRAQTIAKIFPMMADANLFLMLGVLMFIIPVDLKNGVFMMDLKTAMGISWNTFLLLCGGMTMGSMFQAAGIADWLAGKMTFMQNWPVVLIMIVIMLIVAFISELATNQVVALAFVPVVYALSVALGYNPLLLMFTVTEASAFVYMLPSGTPPNALAYGSGYITIPDLIKGGLPVKIASCILFPICTFTISAWLSPLI